MSRVGGNAQIRAMRQVAGSLRLDLAQFRELQAFAQFGSDLDAATQRQLNRGSRLVEVLKQDQYVPLPVERQVVIIYAAINGFVDHLEVAKLKRYESELFRFIDSRKPELFALIRDKKQLSDDVKVALDGVLEQFKGEFTS